MDFVLKYLNPKTLIHLHNLTQKNYYKILAENKLHINLYSIKEISLCDFNILIQDDMSISHIDKELTIRDNKNNIIKIHIVNNELRIKDIIISDLKSYKILNKLIRKLFIELYLDEYKIVNTSHVNCEYKNIKTHKKFGIFSGHKTFYKVT